MVARLSLPVPLEDLAVGASLLWRLSDFLRHPISPPEALATVRRRLDRREADFLDLVRRAIYANEDSPYHDLLRLAGCQYGDLERLVQQEGVEGALLVLFRQGVYLTVEEFKGRRPVLRGSATLAVNPSRLNNPHSAAYVPKVSGGSRGSRTPIATDPAWFRDRAVNLCLCFHARGGIGWQHARWTVPWLGLLRLLEYRIFGARIVRWFTQVHPSGRGLHSRYRWSAGLMRWGGLLIGVRVPRVEFVPLESPLPIAHWMAEVLRDGGTPHMFTFVGQAVRLCQTALEAGIDLHGAQFSMGAEPVTAARLAVVRQTGAQGIPHYGSAESGRIGEGCLAPEQPDDLHVFRDLVALIQAGSDGLGQGLPPDALLVSSLRPTAPLILLNLSLGDQAILTQRDCGCPMERVGWVSHLHTIRSFEKLTAGGVTFLDTDVIRVLEEVLPNHFGGGPTHYQLVEEEAADGRPRLRLLVHPAVGQVDAEAVADVFLRAIGAGSGPEQVMELQWRQAGLLGVEREPPLTTAGGKILHLHVAGRPRAPEV